MQRCRPKQTMRVLRLGTAAIAGSAMRMLLCRLFRISSVKHALNESQNHSICASPSDAQVTGVNLAEPQPMEMTG